LRDLITAGGGYAHKDHYLMALDDQCYGRENTMYLFKDDPNVPSSLLCRRKAKIVRRSVSLRLVSYNIMPPLQLSQFHSHLSLTSQNYERFCKRHVYLSLC